MERRSSTAIAFVVVSYNVRLLLEDCLLSILAEIQANPGLRAEVWVVDNASHDGSPQMVRERFPSVHLIANDDNRGFAAANNQALREIGFGHAGPARRLPPYVAFLNPDTTLGLGALRAWLAAIERRPRAGIVGAALQYPDGQFQHSAFRFPTLLQVLFDFYPPHYRLINSRLNGRYPRALYQRGKPFRIDHPLGAAMLARREAIQSVGLFDEGYFIYAEEIDWCLRMRKAGWGALCAPAVHIVHHEGQSTRQLRGEMFVALWKSRLRLFAKHYGAVFNLAVRWIVRAGLRSRFTEAAERFRIGEIDSAALEGDLEVIREVEALTRQPRRAYL